MFLSLFVLDVQSGVASKAGGTKSHPSPPLELLWDAVKEQRLLQFYRLCWTTTRHPLSGPFSYHLQAFLQLQYCWVLKGKFSTISRRINREKRFSFYTSPKLSSFKRTEPVVFLERGEGWAEKPKEIVTFWKLPPWNSHTGHSKSTRKQMCRTPHPTSGLFIRKLLPSLCYYHSPAFYSTLPTSVPRDHSISLLQAGAKCTICQREHARGKSRRCSSHSIFPFKTCSAAVIKLFPSFPLLRLCTWLCQIFFCWWLGFFP